MSAGQKEMHLDDKKWCKSGNTDTCKCKCGANRQQYGCVAALRTYLWRGCQHLMHSSSTPADPPLLFQLTALPSHVSKLLASNKLLVGTGGLTLEPEHLGAPTWSRGEELISLTKNNPGNRSDK